jgi:hypothetical protein
VEEQDETRRSYRQARAATFESRGGDSPGVALAVSAAAFVKGSIGFGFPALRTPLLTLIVDVMTAFLRGVPRRHRHQCPRRAQGFGRTPRPEVLELVRRVGMTGPGSAEILG